jgi:ligand-binding sensor domain-containing protein/two-component sensor histidine kinase
MHGGRGGFLLRLTLLALLWGNLYAQERLHHHFTTQNGLPSNKVYSISQSRLGYIWIATDRGMARWDGRAFKVFTTDDGLPDNEVVKVFDDDYGRTWIICFNTAPAYIKDGEIFTYKNDSFLARFKSVNLYDYSYLVNKNQYWFSFKNAKGEIELVRSDQPEHLSFVHNEFNEGIDVCDIIPDVLGSYILVANGMVGRLKGQGGGLSMKKLILPQALAGHNLDSRISFSFNDGYYITTDKGMLLRYVLKGDSPILKDILPLPIEPKSYFMRDRQVFIYDEIGNTYDIELKAVSTEFGFLKAKLVNNLFQDNHGNLWVTTINNGCYLYPSNTLKVDNQLPFPDVISMAVFGDYRILGTESRGLVIMDKSMQMVAHYPQVKRPIRIVSTINYCAVANDGSLVYLDKNLQLHTIPGLEVSKDIEVIGGDTLLLGTYILAAKLHLGTPGKPQIVWKNRTNAVWQDVNGVIWLGTLKGLFARKTDGEVVQITHPPELREARVTDIREDEQGRLLVATHQFGLVVLQTGNYRILNRGSNDKRYLLSENHCQRILSTRNYLWLMTDRTVNRIRFVSGTLDVEENLRLDASNGLVVDALYDLAMLPDDRVLAVADRGIVELKIPGATEPRELYLDIQRILVNGVLYRSKQLKDLRADQNTITLYFNAVSLLGGSQLTYEYRLAGLTEMWLTNSTGSVSYSDLPPGNYKFEIRAFDISTGTLSKLQFVDIVIHPSWYHLWWVRLLGVLLLIGFIALIAVYRIKQAEARSVLKNMENRRLAELELQAMRSRMNPHFVFNILTSIQNFITQGREKEANFYTSQFAQLIRQTFQVSARNFTTISMEIEMLNNYLDLECMRFDKRMDYQIDCDSEIDADAVEIPSMMIQPFVENAINHGIRPLRDRRGFVSIRILPVEEDRLHIVIEDNGIGISAARVDRQMTSMKYTHRSEGLQLTRNRIDTMNRYYGVNIFMKITDLANEGGQGTRVDIQLPMYIPTI